MFFPSGTSGFAWRKVRGSGSAWRPPRNPILSPLLQRPRFLRPDTHTSTKWLPQQPEARSRRRSGPRARVRDDTRTTSTAPFRLRRSDCAQRAPTLLNSDTRHARRDQGESCADSSVVKDKAQHAVVLDKNVTDKLNKDVQSYRLITVATLVDRLKINGSLARKALKDLEAQGQIKKVVGHSKLSVYSASPPSISAS